MEVEGSAMSGETRLELKPCPFCGAKGRKFRKFRGAKTYIMKHKKKCTLYNPKYRGNRPVDIFWPEQIKIWNLRPLPNDKEKK